MARLSLELSALVVRFGLLAMNTEFQRKDVRNDYKLGCCDMRLFDGALG